MESYVYPLKGGKHFSPLCPLLFKNRAFLSTCLSRPELCGNLFYRLIASPLLIITCCPAVSTSSRKLKYNTGLFSMKLWPLSQILISVSEKSISSLSSVATWELSFFSLTCRETLFLRQQPIILWNSVCAQHVQHCVYTNLFNVDCETSVSCFFFGKKPVLPIWYHLYTSLVWCCHKESNLSVTKTTVCL